MLTPTIQRVSHEIEIDATPDQVFELLRDAARWPLILAPTLHVEYLERTPTDERLRIWARANDGVRSWESHRQIDEEARTIGFEQVTPARPVAAMSGRWSVRPGRTLAAWLVLDHAYAAIDDRAEDLEWIARATDRNSTAELAGIKAIAEEQGGAEASFAFADTVTVAGRAEDVYRFLFEAEAWSTRLGHVAAARVTELGHDVQTLEMDTVAPDGSTHSTHSYRVCQSPRSIAYKQTSMPALLRAHTGRWSLVPDGDHVQVTSEHAVTLAPAAVTTVLGPDASLADARGYVQAALSANSMKTLHAAKAWAESSWALS
jgi:aromatase